MGGGNKFGVGMYTKCLGTSQVRQRKFLEGQGGWKFPGLVEF